MNGKVCLKQKRGGGGGGLWQLKMVCHHLSDTILYITSFLTLRTKFHHKEQRVTYEFSRMPYPEINA